MAQPPPATAEKKPKSFEALTPALAEWILDYTRSMNFARTTPVQAMAIPLLMGNKDLVVEAVTGSGKTLSFLVPIISRILAVEEPNKKGHVRSIVVAPTKELASQIYEVCVGLLRYHPPSAFGLDGGKDDGLDDVEVEEGADAMEAKPERPAGAYVVPQLLIGGRTKQGEDLATFSSLNPNLLIGTPKRLVEILSSSRVVLKRHYFDLLVLDEADRLLDPNFAPDLQRILELVPKERRTGLFSASVSEAVNELVRVGMRYPFKISAKVRSKSGALDKKTPEALRLCYLTCPATQKLPMLKRVLLEVKAEKIIIYVSTRAGVDYWKDVLPALLGMKVFAVHGDYKAPVRAKNVARFQDCTTPAILVTTDVLARGIDIPDIDLVVQLDPPSQPKDFIHRCGRSGRAGKRGLAITFLNDGNEADYVKYLDLQGTKLEPYILTTPITPAEATETISQIRQVLTTKREIHDRSQKAFVSWVQAYTKTLPADIFNVKNVDWKELGQAWGLLRWPKMPELKRLFPEAVADRTLGLDVPEAFDINHLAYADKVREETRQLAVQARARGERPALPKRLAGKEAEAKMKRERAWSSQKAAKGLREERRGRKEGRRVAERKKGMSEGEKVESAELEDLIRRIREQNAEEEFEGFD
ncbi:ATP-dependent rRNA helicase spb4 [Recurvomyces mirabilis]|uniref:RNA helicase n=1 Tax=Recurvomyces mirabilis TaxID=574656 RepID=A0AAE0TN98_9PEZI|nr:ATP-dependent rRNA helicase spb4 [Recurvomyces mirabilis]KAK5153067.1 ATP-dependent rRNA helicase spb4 [Recurvomyces mirabilis]